jgi:uncharacterized protein YciI
MKRCLALAILLAAVCFGQAKPEPKYEMDKYVVGLLRKGPKWTPGSTAETQKIQEGHMANIRRMGETGKLVVAGPFLDGGDLRGIFIFKATMEEAQAMANEDPAVKAGRLVIDFHPWFAAKGLSVAPPIPQ